MSANISNHGDGSVHDVGNSGAHGSTARGDNVTSANSGHGRKTDDHPVVSPIITLPPPHPSGGETAPPSSASTGAPIVSLGGASVGSSVSGNADSIAEFPLRIEAKTWQRDSHDLFDYEDSAVFTQDFVVSRHVKLFRRRTEIDVTIEGHPLPSEEADCLLNVKVKDGKYFISSAEKSLPQNIVTKKLWTIVKELPGESHLLQENDVIKLGRYKLRVKQLVAKNDIDVDIRLDDSEISISDSSEDEVQVHQCRICLLDGGSVDDPLICPCQCKGSIKFVHVECLRRWINGRLNLTDGARFFFKQLPCELCKQHFPTAVRLLRTGEKIQIAKIPRPTPPFIVLENMVGTPNSRGVHVISMAEKKILKLGRGHESDLRIPDVSISRYHATIGYDDGKFTLGDHGSKFGTLVSLRRPQALDAHGDPSSRRYAVQVGRTVVNFQIEGFSSHGDSMHKSEVKAGMEMGQSTGSNPDRIAGNQIGHRQDRESGQCCSNGAQRGPADFGSSASVGSDAGGVQECLFDEVADVDLCAASLKLPIMSFSYPLMPPYLLPHLDHSLVNGTTPSSLCCQPHTAAKHDGSLLRSHVHAKELHWKHFKGTDSNCKRSEVAEFPPQATCLLHSERTESGSSTSEAAAGRESCRKVYGASISPMIIST